MKTLLKKSKLFALVLVIVFCTTFSACIYKGYEGENPEFCSIAWASQPMLAGHSSNGEALYDAEVCSLQTDEYGRVLFSYYENSLQTNLLVFVMQYKQGDKAYYYDDYCYTLIIKENKDQAPDLTSPEIQALKQANDWGKPLDESKCTSTQIVNKKPEGSLKLKDDFFEKIIRDYHENSDRYVNPKNLSFVSYFRFFVADNYGREIITVYTHFEEHTEKTELRYSFVFLVLVNPDKTVNEKAVILLDQTKIQNINNTASQLKAQNGWNTPYNK